MKVMYVLMAMAFASAANAQDFCKQIKKEVSDNKVQTDYYSPFAADNMPAVRVKRVISTDPEFSFDNYTIMFQTYCGLDDIYNKTADGGQTEKAEKKLTILFEDNTTYVDDTTDISHDFTEDRTEAIRNLYLTLTPDMVNKFSDKKIIKFSLAGQERKFPTESSNALMQYVRCIKAAK